MEILVEVRRQHSPADVPYYQTIKYQAASDEENVATVLRNLNATPELRDTENREVGEIHWQCSCLQKKTAAPKNQNCRLPYTTQNAYGKEGLRYIHYSNIRTT